MLYLIAVPIVIIAVVVRVVSEKYKLDIMLKISNTVIIVGVLFFMHFYAVSKGFNIIDVIIKFFTL